MLDKKNLLALMKVAANATPSQNYNWQGESLSSAAINKTLHEELNSLYEEDQKAAFALIEETLTEVVPTRLLNEYGRFAEIKTYGQGERPIFKRKIGHNRAKQFVTRVGLAGVYEVFKLAEESFEMKTSAIGTAVQIGFEEYLDGRVDFAELMQVATEGMTEFIYREIAKAMMASVEQLPAANKVVVAGWDPVAMDYIINTASVYGKPTIYCTREFAVKMIPDTNWVSEGMKESMWNTGYLGTYKGCSVVIMPQSFEDETNSVKVIDPSYVWVIPAGDNDRPVKVAFEGSVHVRERDNKDDWSRDIQMYHKVGVGVMMTNNIFSYVDTSLKGLDNVSPIG